MIIIITLACLRQHPKTCCETHVSRALAYGAHHFTQYILEAGAELISKTGSLSAKRASNTQSHVHCIHVTLTQHPVDRGCMLPEHIGPLYTLAPCSSLPDAVLNLGPHDLQASLLTTWLYALVLRNISVGNREAQSMQLEFFHGYTCTHGIFWYRKLTVQESSQTVPHSPLCSISTRPLEELLPINLRFDAVNTRITRYAYNWLETPYY